MTRVYDLLFQGGLVMIPIFGLSILTISCGLDRALFWFRLLSQEASLVKDVLAATRDNLEQARDIAESAQHLPIGRFLYAPLKLRHPTPETFRLALEAAGDKELIQMRKGDKLLETIVAVAPLLGLLGTVTGLINTFNNLKIGATGTTVEATKVAGGIGEALITTAAGMIVAIIALLILRTLVTLHSNQMDYFAEVGTELELIYRQIWYEPSLVQPIVNPLSSHVQPTDTLNPEQKGS